MTQRCRWSALSGISTGMVRCRVDRDALTVMNALARQEAGILELAHGAVDGGAQVCDVLVGMRGGEEAVTPFPDVNAALHQMVEEEILVALKSEPEEGAEVDHLDGDLSIREPGVEIGRKGAGALVELLVETGTALLDLLQHGPRRGQAERVLAEGAGHERGLGTREGCVPVPPHPAIEGVE
jgi:hypothetical protein